MPGADPRDPERVVLRDVPVLMYTANSDPDAARTAIGMGARECLVKGRMGFRSPKQVIERHLN